MQGNQHADRHMRTAENALPVLSQIILSPRSGFCDDDDAADDDAMSCCSNLQHTPNGLTMSSLQPEASCTYLDKM